ncbi:uncharacterized protein LOC135384923 [Ornithodoros turicata]|uniref:uncharacterized protein LOC135384923 n=1 Tax=Ornithodoros turicata TaxID=34597 RepID=UPI003139046B
MSEGSIALHMFCDASPRAYGAAAYLVTLDRDGHYSADLLLAKSRVAPVKTVSLPRLELMGAVIATRLMGFLQTTLSLSTVPTVLWTDSEITLYWIYGSTNDWKPFVQNRVSEIRAGTEPSQWRHCPGKENPADLLTRGTSCLQLLNNSVWWQGPSWLMDQKSWPPAWRTPDEPCVEVRNETKAQTACCVPILATTTLMDVAKYSSLHRLLRVTAWVSRFLHNCRHTTAESRGPLTAAEVVAAETYWVTAAQLQAYHSRKEEHPIVIPADHSFTALLVFRAHVRLLHAGVQETLAALREEYWVLRGRQVVKRIVNGCRTCRRTKVQACTEVTAPLPRDRLSQSAPFEVTGTDFAGPLYYKCSKDGGRKCYILIFTCAVTRAVHLELTKSVYRGFPNGS